jgi:hypothetical protein
MTHAEFTLGLTFWCGGRRWRCTEIATRTIKAIPFDSIKIVESGPNWRRERTLTHEEAEQQGWFNGPPYALAEYVFNENDIRGCSLNG